MKSILSLLQFTTIIPLGKQQDFDLFARHSWLFPLAGYVIAFLVAIPVFFITDRTLAAAVAVAGVILLSGAHHFDGLLDFGDGLMAQGDREKRTRALTDRYVGAGGIAAGTHCHSSAFWRAHWGFIRYPFTDYWRGLCKIFHGLSYCIWDALQKWHAQLPPPVCETLFPLPFASSVHSPCFPSGVTFPTCSLSDNYDIVPLRAQCHI